MPEFSYAPQVEAIGQELIGPYHTHLETYEVTVKYWFRDDTPKKSGRIVLGTAEKVSGKAKFHAREEDDFFLIVISEPQWNKLSDIQRRALVDHELMHCLCEMNEEVDPPRLELSLRGHDVEEFADIIGRYGMWKGDLKHFMATAAAGGHIQLKLDLQVEPVERTG